MRDLRAGYGELPVLHGIDLDVDAGEVVVLLGANGAGKTTTLRALSGLVPATGASSSTGRRRPAEPAEDPPIWCARGIAHVPQGRGTLPGLTVEDNLRAGAITRRDRGVAADIDRTLRDLPAAGRTPAHAPPARCPAASSRCSRSGRALLSPPPAAAARRALPRPGPRARPRGARPAGASWSPRPARRCCWSSRTSVWPSSWPSRGYVLEPVGRGVATQRLGAGAIRRAYLVGKRRRRGAAYLGV